MKPATIYTRSFCSYSARALALLKKKNVPFTEINAGMNAPLRKEMIKRSGGARTYPQIFIADLHIGGCDEIMALEASGKLDTLLAE